MNHQLYVRYIHITKPKKLSLKQLQLELKNQLKSNEELIRWAIVDSKDDLIIEAGIKANN